MALGARIRALVSEGPLKGLWEAAESYLIADAGAAPAPISH